MQVPRIDFDGGYVDQVRINLGIRDNNSISLGFNGEHNAVVLRAFNIGGEITGFIKYRYLFVTVNADFTVTFEEGAVSMETMLALATQIIEERQIP